MPLESSTHILPQPFFLRPTLTVARELLGMLLVRDLPGSGPLALRIVETEAYEGPEDLASHARFGSNRRNQLMFDTGGHWYVYLIYGIHHMLNITTGPPGVPGAVLIRGLETLIGPGRLTRALGIDRSLNGLPAAPASGLYLMRPPRRPRKAEIAAGPRIGIDYAGPDWASRPHRFYLPAQVDARGRPVRT